MEKPETKNGPRWGIIAAIIAALGLMSLFGSGNDSSRAADSQGTASTRSAPRGYGAGSVDSSSTPRADTFTSSTGAYMDDREKQLYEGDPSSMGYTDADREFLREHGMTEQEARAAETVLHEHGIDD